MTVRRIMGTETEFGISVLGTPSANPMLTSSQLVNAYASLSARSRRARWDFEEESPLRDARGFDLSRNAADPSQLTDEDIGLANLILTNGARLYVDHAHPEYSTPEVTNPLDVVRWDKAGELVVNAAAHGGRHPRPEPARALQEQHRQQGRVLRRARELPDGAGDAVPRHHPAPDAVLRHPPGGLRRGPGRASARTAPGTGFQISQRADYFEVEVGLETTLKRPIINTRDEPHADPERYRRLHVIIGDANMAEISCYLKVGTTALVLSMIEDGAISAELTHRRPGATRCTRSRTTRRCSTCSTLKDGRTMTALDLQEQYLELARGYVENHYGDDVDVQTKDVLVRWQSVLDRLRRDPMECRKELDWVAKLALLESYRDRDGLEWDDPKLHLIDLQYADLRPDKGLYQRLVARGSIERLLDDDEVVAARSPQPPEDTRAYFRGRCLAQYPERIAAASWDSVIFDLPGRDSLQRIPTMEPSRGTKQHVGALLTAAADGRGAASPRSTACTARPSRRPSSLYLTGRGAPWYRRMTGPVGWFDVRSVDVGTTEEVADGTRRWPAAQDHAQVERGRRTARDRPGRCRRRAQGEARRRRRRDPRRHRRGPRVQRRGVRARVRPEGRRVTSMSETRLPAAFMTPGSSSFADFLAEHSPDLLPGASRQPAPAGAVDAPHGTTIVAATFAGGVVMAGDRRATMGNIIAQRDIEKVFPGRRVLLRRHRRHRRVSRSRWSGCSRPSSSTTRRSRAPRCRSTARPTGSRR